MTRPIRGVALLRNEENFAAWALMNAVAFCDHLLVLDNGSTDGTRAVVDAIAARHGHVEVIDVPDHSDTHRFVEPWAREDGWVLGVDGDEIWDPEGLARLRPRLLAGEYDRFWRLVPHTLHVWTLDAAAGRARGYASPPARPLPKLFNFAAIDGWPQGRHERLHGKAIRFRAGFDADTLCDMRHEPWETADFRCLHACFLPRRRDAPLDGAATAPNPAEHRSRAKPLRRLRDAALRAVGVTPPEKPDYKLAHYAAGPLVDRDARAFRHPGCFREVDPHGPACVAQLDALARRRGAG